MTDSEGPAELRQRVHELQGELDGLRLALRNRATIEQAMGVLVVSHQCTPQEAFRLLIGFSQQYNVKLHRVAQLLVRLAAQVDVSQLEPLLRRASASAATMAEEADEEPGGPDRELLDAARELVQSGSSPQALGDLYQLLLDRGWLPPYSVLSKLK